jgi:RimJ/RimL family protein N-acetyltransferase
MEDRSLANLPSYVSMETLKDGTRVTLRAIRADDGPRIRRAFRNLDPQTIYTRFFGYKADVSDVELKRITNVDFHRDVALLVTIGSGDDEVVIGGASYFAIDAGDPPRRAEIAFTVEEDYQGRGMAGILMRHMAQIARENGLVSLEAEVLSRNLPMLGVFQRSTLPMTLRREDDVVHVTLSVQPEG